MQVSSVKLVGIILLSLGIVGIFLSDFYQSLPLAFIGLTLTFWGCLFLLVLSGKYVKSEVMDYMGISSLLALDRMIAGSNVQGKPIYIPVIKESYLPMHVEAKNEFVYIPNKDESEDRIIEQAFMRNPPGIRITPPGSGLADLVEKKSGEDLRKLDMDSLKNILPSVMTQDLELASDLKIDHKWNMVHIEVSNPICEDLCREAKKMEKICPNLGCPLSSSIACILTRVTNKPVIIERCEAKTGRIEILYRLV